VFVRLIGDFVPLIESSLFLGIPWVKDAHGIFATSARVLRPPPATII
jgi:hypothetical protein